MRALYRFFKSAEDDDIEGVFISETEDVKILLSLKSEIDFGGIFGEYSRYKCFISKNDILFLTDDPNVLNVVEEYGLDYGENPFHQHTSYEFKDKKGDHCKIVENVQKLINMIKSKELFED